MLYSLGIRTAGTVLSFANLELSTSATQGCRIYEIGVSSATASSGLGLGKPSLMSVNPTYLVNGTGQGFQAETDTGAPVAQTRVAVAWTTAPFIANPNMASFIRRASLTAAVGSCIIWNFPKGYFVPPGSTGLNSLCIFNTILNGTLDVWIVIDE